MSELVAIAAARSPSNAIDIGCGAGSLSIGLAASTAVNICAIDVNVMSLERAKAAAKKTSQKGRVEFFEQPLEDQGKERYDLVVCIGSSGAAGSPRDALALCKRFTSSRGTFVFAELVWNQKPPAEFLTFPGIQEDHYWTHAADQEVLREFGFTVDHRCEASVDSWAQYEEAIYAGRLRYAKELPI